MYFAEAFSRGKDSFSGAVWETLSSHKRTSLLTQLLSLMLPFLGHGGQAEHTGRASCTLGVEKYPAGLMHNQE